MRFVSETKYIKIPNIAAGIDEFSVLCLFLTVNDDLIQNNNNNKTLGKCAEQKTFQVSPSPTILKSGEA